MSQAKKLLPQERRDRKAEKRYRANEKAARKALLPAIDLASLTIANLADLAEYVWSIQEAALLWGNMPRNACGKLEAVFDAQWTAAHFSYDRIIRELEGREVTEDVAVEQKATALIIADTRYGVGLGAIAARASKAAADQAGFRTVGS